MLKPLIFAPLRLCVGLGICLFLAACQPQSQAQVFRATVPPVQDNAPVYTDTPTFTPSATFTASPTLTATPTPTLTPTVTFTPSPTQPLLTLTPPSPDGAPPPAGFVTAAFAPTAGWTCDDFPCENDVAGFMERIEVPRGFRLSHIGRFPGQPMQITYGPDGRLYATVLENGTRSGAVYAMNDTGVFQRYSSEFVAPVGLAFQPGTDVLYVTARVTLERGGGLWRVLPDGSPPQAVIDDLPCCFQIVDNQPNGIVFGPDGYLYMGVGSLTDQAEPPPGPRSQYTETQPYEASILRIQPHTGAIEVYASGLRNAYDLTFTSDGQFYATDNGLLSGIGDRLVAVNQGAHYGWPFWRSLGCENCPPAPPRLEVAPHLLDFPRYTLPRGIAAYTGGQFPANMFDSLFVALWNGIEGGQRVVRINPQTAPTNPDALAQYQPEPFVTGLIRPVDVAVAPDGSLVVADFIYGHVWRVSYEG